MPQKVFVFISLRRLPITTPIQRYITIIIYFSLLFACALSNADVCSIQDYEYAKANDNYYLPQDAYNFGKKIQSLVSKQDLADLFALVDGELESGPRKEFVKDRKFSDIFSKSWQEEVLKYAPPCSPLGWRGFSLGGGLVWFNIINGSWQIFAINGTKAEQLPKIAVGLRVAGKLLPCSCFSRVWYSEDNYKEYFAKFKLQNYQDFIANPGKYFAKDIVDLSPVTPSWVEEDRQVVDEVELLSLTLNVSKCQSNLSNITIKDNYIYELKHGCNSNQRYKVISKINPKKYQELAPNLYANCESMCLIETGENSNGSIGWDNAYAIYGIFKFKDKNKYIIPLKNFINKNMALNYLNYGD